MIRAGGEGTSTRRPAVSVTVVFRSAQEIPFPLNPDIMIEAVTTAASQLLLMCSISDALLSLAYRNHDRVAANLSQDNAHAVDFMHYFRRYPSLVH